MRRAAPTEPRGVEEPPLDPAGDWLPAPDLGGSSEVFRETFLLRVTEPGLNRALRVLGKVLHDMVLEHAHHWPRLPGSLDEWDLRAVAGDLRHVQSVLERVAREPDASGEPARTADGILLSALAADDATRVSEIAGQLTRDLERCRSRNPGG